MPQALTGAGIGFFVCGPACAIAGAVIMVGAGVAAMYVGAKAGDYVAEHVLLAKKNRQSGKESTTNIPSWAKGKQKQTGESGKDATKRVMDKQYEPGNWQDTGPK